MTFNFQTKIWLYSGKAAWHFVTLPQDLSQEIKILFGDMQRGWGSLPVKVTVRKTTWQTSIFYDQKSNAYLLPIKSIIRKKESLKENDQVAITLRLIV